MNSSPALRYGLFGLVALLFSLLALTPLGFVLGRLDLDRIGLSAGGATGSVWRGALQDARLGPMSLGDVEARLGLFPLLTGKIRLALASDEFEGALVRSRRGIAVDSFTGRIALASMMDLEVEKLGARFESGRCEEASGRASVVPAAEMSALGLSDRLSGLARCDGANVLLPLVGRGGLARLDLRIDAQGRHDMRLGLRPESPVQAQALAAAGFRPAGAFMVRRIPASR